MELPAGLIRTSIGALVTSAVANTTTTGTLLAAPGVGFRHRLWGASIGPANTAQAVVNWKMVMTDATSGVGILIWTGNNFASPGGFQAIPGGYALSDNRGIGYSIQSALASLSLQGYFFTTLEATV